MENELLPGLAEARTSDATATFGHRIRTLRKARGWSQQVLADRMSALGQPMHQTQIAKLEGGGRPTTIDELIVLARILEVEPGDLIQQPVTNEARRAVDAALLNVQEIKAELREVNLQMEALQRRKRELGRERSEALKRWHAARKAFGVSRSRTSGESAQKSAPTAAEFMTGPQHGEEK